MISTGSCSCSCIGPRTCTKLAGDSNDLRKIPASPNHHLYAPLFAVISSNASIGFALYNCCLQDHPHCQQCGDAVIPKTTTLTNTFPVMPMINNYEFPERITYDRNKFRTLDQMETVDRKFRALDQLEIPERKFRAYDQVEIPERIYDRNKYRYLEQSDFPKVNYTQSLPRYVVMSNKPTNV